MKNKLMDAADAARLIRDGSTVTVSGVIGWLVPERVLAEVENRYVSTGHPRDLVIFEPSPIGPGPGQEHWLQPGMVRRLVTSALDQAINPELCARVLDGDIEAFALPLGVMHQLIEEIARRSPGLLTKVGLGTYVDPRLGQCGFNSSDAAAEVVTVDDGEWLMYRSFPIDVAIIRGSSADTAGNLVAEEDPLRLGVFYQAMAAKNSGGMVIAQVGKIVSEGDLDPWMVTVPGLLVDAVVVDPDQNISERFPGMVTEGLNGRKRIAPPQAPQFPNTIETFIGRRAALELRSGMTVNFGGGVPRFIPLLLLKEDVSERIHTTLEHAVLGGINYGRMVHVNPTSFLSYQQLFNWYQGGGLDMVILGFGEIDESGGINLTRLGPTGLRGPGGAMDLATHASVVLFVGTFTYGKMDWTVSDGKLVIESDAGVTKFVKAVRQVTISAARLVEQGKRVMAITERCVLEYTLDGWVMAEIADGLDLEKDVLRRMDFRPSVVEALKTMPSAVWSKGELNLKDVMGDVVVHKSPGDIEFIPFNELEVSQYWAPEL